MQQLRMLYKFCCVPLLMLLASINLGLCQAPVHLDKAEWLKVAADELDEVLTTKKNENKAKNVIMFLGDGMGISTITAGRIYKGQQNKKNGESFKLAFDRFPHTALIKTYSEDKTTPDSAATATAFLSGVKTNNGIIGYDGRVKYGVCPNEMEDSKVNSILDWALAAGKSVGIVTTTRVTHATPAATYAHSPKREWESDRWMPKNTSCKDIARQLIEDNPNINVILGGGRSNFLPDNTPDPEYANKTGYRRDGRNLIEHWKKDHPKNAKYVWNMKEFKNVDPQNTDYLLGLFEMSHLHYEVEREEKNSDDPNLATMTEKAIQILSKNSLGFFLLVEGGRIDHGHHSNSAIKALSELSSFDDAVAKGVDMTKEEDTLIIVSADHSHVFNIAGYPERGVNILDKVPYDPVNKGPKDNMPMTILVYGNGPGYTYKRENLTDIDTTSKIYLQQSAIPMKDDTHGGKDVAAYAQGPMSHLIRGVKEQNYLAVVMGYSSCTRKHTNSNTHCTALSSSRRSVPLPFLLLILTIIIQTLSK